MNILMVSSESVPFSKSGGLADVVGALSTALSTLGSDIRVLIPCYGCVDTSGFSDLAIDVEVSFPGKAEHVFFMEKKLGKVRFYLVCHPWFQKRNGIYGENSFSPYPDNLQRYMLLNKAAMPLCKALKWVPDILHCHDWTCGFIPYFLKKSNDDFFAHTKSLMTIHNLAYQGDYSRLQLLDADIEPDARMFSGKNPEKRVNFLKTGIEFADTITTVSPTYAKEIQTKELGCNLEQLLLRRSNVLQGIINGIDYVEWNPETDVFLENHFSLEDRSGKHATKALIQDEYNLRQDPTIPLFSMISRIADQKGFVELLEGNPCALEKIVRDYPLQFILVGTGDQTMEKKLIELGSQYENLSVNILFSSKAAHRIEAASDFFLMPSRYEPCGLNQLYSLRYGTLPIARRTGGLADSIVDLDESPAQGTGILFKTISGDAIIEAVERALLWWEKGPEELERIQTRCMKFDSTWEQSARSYIKIYETSLREKESW